jgi:hypothetical protein
MKKVNEDFLGTLDVGSRIFKYNKPVKDKESKNDADDYILYTVISLKQADRIELMNIFDKEETSLKISIKELLGSDHWFYNPEFLL